ncbi:hypothetical protein BT96DRAFT_1081114 [Gymnopus androsaceus JB14]|uniref:DUF6534 domain-containing protein n=1 Tax=Gymnopus androsaceus JB14 TaxID=1447944 RepID=A0A6A4GN09_9AGAR|nr:hypothetical protein BT96DRAFT_1081114 [Gymnopus androsaceus JB14]
MSNTTEVPVSTDTLLLIGPILVGSLFSWCLFGISIVQLQTKLLFLLKNKVSDHLKVYAVFVLDIFQSVVVANVGWHTLCTGWGHPSALQFPGWTFSALPCVSGFVSAWVQVFFAWRIRNLGKWRVVPLVIVLLGLAQCGAACAIGIGFIPLKNIAELHRPDMFARTIVWLGGAALADILIAVSMIYLLYSAKQNIVFKKTDKMISRLIRITVETGAITATSAILELILFRASASSNLHLTIALMLCKIYSNAFMACLNSRAGSGLVKTVVTENESSVQWNSFGHVFNDSPSGIGSGNNATVVHLQKTTQVHSDETNKRVKHFVFSFLPT